MRMDDCPFKGKVRKNWEGEPPGEPSPQQVLAPLRLGGSLALPISAGL